MNLAPHRMTVLLLLSLLIACGESTDDAQAPPEHFLKDQEGVLDEAKQIEQLIQDADAEKRRQIDEQSGY